MLELSENGINYNSFKTVVTTNDIVVGKYACLLPILTIRVQITQNLQLYFVKLFKTKLTNRGRDGSLKKTDVKSHLLNSAPNF